VAAIGIALFLVARYKRRLAVTSAQ